MAEQTAENSLFCWHFSRFSGIIQTDLDLCQRMPDPLVKSVFICEE